MSDTEQWETFRGSFLDGPWTGQERELTMQVGSDRNVVFEAGSYRPEEVDADGMQLYRWHGRLTTRTLGVCDWVDCEVVLEGFGPGDLIRERISLVGHVKPPFGSGMLTLCDVHRTQSQRL
jgi:hypothetical protein